jgi:hypothetical protein
MTAARRPGTGCVAAFPSPSNSVSEGNGMDGSDLVERG